MTVGVVGSTMIDLITYTPRLPEPGETLEAPEFELGCGGKGANQAVAAARLGADVTMIARVGSDAFGDLCLQALTAEGIDVSHVRRTEGANGVAPVFVEPDGDNRVIVVKGANAALSPDDVEAAGATLAACDLVLVQLETPVETAYAVVEFGRQHDVPVLFNPAPGDPDLDLDRIRHATFFTPNETELSLLTGLPVGSVDEARVAARTLVDHGLHTVIVTLGARGLLHIGPGVDEFVPAPVVDVVDTTGAGDAFNGAFAHHWTTHRDTGAALKYACAYASDSVTRRGTQKSYATADAFAATAAGRSVSGPTADPSRP